MPSSAIVAGIDAVDDVRQRDCKALIHRLLSALLLHAAKECLGHSISPATVFSAQVWLKVIGAAEVPLNIAAGTRALIGVNDGASRSSLPHGRREPSMD